MNRDDVHAMIRSLGGYAAVGRALGLQRQAVHCWTRVPAHHCIALERLSRGRYTRDEMRPDVFAEPPSATTSTP